jgi:hypothetical protein
MQPKITAGTGMLAPSLTVDHLINANLHFFEDTPATRNEED